MGSFFLGGLSVWDVFPGWLIFVAAIKIVMTEDQLKSKSSTNIDCKFAVLVLIGLHYSPLS